MSKEVTAKEATAKETMYEIAVTGEFIRGVKSDITREIFEAKFTLPVKGGEALSLIQNSLIVPHLKKKHADFKRFRTCQIVSTKAVGGKGVAKLKAKDIPSMTLEQLIMFAGLEGLKVNVGDYASTEDARKAVQIALDDKKMQATIAKRNEDKKAKATTAAGKAGDEDAGSDSEFPDDI